MLIKEGATLVLPQLSLELGSCEYFHTFCLHFVRFRSSRIVESVPIVVVVQLGLEFRKRLVAGWQVLPIREYRRRNFRVLWSKQPHQLVCHLS